MHLYPSAPRPCLKETRGDLAPGSVITCAAGTPFSTDSSCLSVKADEQSSDGIAKSFRTASTSAFQMPAEKIFDEHPGGTDGLGAVVLSFIEKWLRVTVVRTWINEHLVRSFCRFHAGKEIDS